MKLPEISISRWAINDRGDVYRPDGYVGIGTDNPGGLIGLQNEYTNISVNSDGEMTFTDPVSGTFKLSELIDGYNSVTTEVLSIAVNYDLGTDPSPARVFNNQSDYDAWNAANGSNGFKHIMTAWESIPSVILHNIIITLSSGVHRPRSPEPSTSAAFQLDRKVFGLGITCTFNGSTTWTDIVASQSVTSSQTGSGDPWIDVSGTPYSSGALRGLFALTSGAQKCVIHDNTTNRLNVINQLSPASPTTVTVQRPSTIIRNSINDSTSVNASTSLWLDVAGTILFNDIQFDPWLAAFAVSCQGRTPQRHQFTRCLWDYAYQKDTFGISYGSASGWHMANSGSIIFSSCSLRTDRLAAIPTTGFDLPINAGGFSCFISSCYVDTADDPIEVNFGSLFSFSKSVVDGPHGITIYDGSLQAQNIGGSKNTTIRNKTVSPGLRIYNGRFNTAAIQQIYFEGNSGQPCVKIEGQYDAWTGSPPDFLQGIITNSDVGIEVMGPNTKIKLSSATNVTGTLGDTRINGVLRSYLTISTSGPIIDDNVNIWVDKA